MSRPESLDVPPLPRISRAIGGELLGTFLLVFFGCGAVHAAVLTGAQVGLWQVAIVWGLGIMLAVFLTGGMSGAHLNPAVTLGLTAGGLFPVGRVMPYVLAQVGGAFAAAAVLFGLFQPHIDRKEREKEVIRGEPGSIVTAMCYGEYFPNPGGIATASGRFDAEEWTRQRRLVPRSIAWGAEFLGTLILMLVIRGTTDPGNRSAPPAGLAPVAIGLTVSVLISILAPLTQACFNPARDFGPRLFSAWAGWGDVAWMHGDHLSWLGVYVAAPVLGAVFGSLLYGRLHGSRRDEDV